LDEDQGNLQYQLPGKFTFTNGSSSVTTTASMVDRLAIGDALYPEGGAGIVASVTSTTVTLTTVFAGATVTSVAGYSSRKRISLPFTRLTSFGFPEVGEFGGDPRKVLMIGGMPVGRYRGVGYRPIVQMEWQMLEPFEVEHLAAVFDWRRYGQIELQPHLDVPIRWIVLPISEFEPRLTSDKAVGIDLSVTFQTVRPIKELPASFAGAGRFSPKMW